MKLNEFTESMTCSECGGPAFTDLILAEKKDACYNKVRSRYKVWPSAYASGALVQCRKKGAANWGNKSKNEDVAEGVGNIGSKIKALYQQIYSAGDDAVEFAYNDSPIFAQYWDEYEGDLDSIIAEVDPSELQVIAAELESAVEDQGLTEMDKSQPSHGRDGRVSHSTYGSRDKKGPDYFKGKEAPSKPITKKEMEKHALDILKKQGVAEGNYDRDDYYNARRGSEYGRGLAATGHGGDGSATRRDDIFKGQSKRLPADPFARTTGAVPTAGTGRIHSTALPGEMEEGEKIGNMDADAFDAAMARLKKLAGAGPMRTVYDPNRRQYRNMPTAQQPAKQPKK